METTSMVECVKQPFVEPVIQEEASLEGVTLISGGIGGIIGGLP